MNKNWNDRADKDLFFTILSVKNIGVISGSEWTTIGNHMRTLGYGFTNEGCRQHFQGLRRAQHKADSNGGSSDNPRRADPTMNPITRRPGPGRGRPKKQQQQPAPMPIPPLSAQAGQPGQLPPPGQPQSDQAELVDQQQQPQQQPQHQQQPQLQPAQPAEESPQQQQPPPPPGAAGIPDGLHSLPDSMDLPLKDDTLDMSLKEDDNDDDNEEHQAKRLKLDDTPPDQSLDDEAVLALAAHSNAPSVDPYASEYPTAGLNGSESHAFSYGGDT
ncbi:hypothetical protein CkaCkLH20_04873 [Colletotrichum karsti]|uniref:Myb-like domain-containing protein n=1 Tax=Colletotrichum karsti TaxID=1095194 RepID=A0A9P6LLG4_9PEZI|nr:uncharacterized protein CkaCkLH20_04873 [Colletotrichum karsti]KAF9877738.1 hypothetical protein CkaCkLH20_04873 [Colletotrichum karsti]